MKVMVFDVGGTEIKYSVMDEQMNRFDAGSVPTPQDTQEHFLDTIYALYAPHKDEVDGIAMALPGFVDANTGYVSNGGALLYNTGTQVGQLVRERCGCRVTLENDGKAAAIAELRAGALQGCCNAAVFIIGTGVGGGIIANGQLVRGVHFTAGEYSFVNTNADEWENTEKNMACQCSTKYLLKWYRARKGLPADAPMNGKLFFDAANAAEPESGRRSTSAAASRGIPTRESAGSIRADIASISPVSRISATAVITAQRHGAICPSVINPSFAPRINASYTLTLAHIPIRTQPTTIAGSSTLTFFSSPRQTPCISPRRILSIPSSLPEQAE